MVEWKDFEGAYNFDTNVLKVYTTGSPSVCPHEYTRVTGKYIVIDSQLHVRGKFYTTFSERVGEIICCGNWRIDIV